VTFFFPSLDIVQTPPSVPVLFRKMTQILHCQKLLRSCVPKLILFCFPMAFAFGDAWEGRNRFGNDAFSIESNGSAIVHESDDALGVQFSSEGDVVNSLGRSHFRRLSSYGHSYGSGYSLQHALRPNDTHATSVVSANTPISIKVAPNEVTQKMIGDLVGGGELESERLTWGTTKLRQRRAQSAGMNGKTGVFGRDTRRLVQRLSIFHWLIALEKTSEGLHMPSINLCQAKRDVSHRLTDTTISIQKPQPVGFGFGVDGVEETFVKRVDSLSQLHRRPLFSEQPNDFSRTSWMVRVLRVEETFDCSDCLALVVQADDVVVHGNRGYTKYRTQFVS